MLYFDNSNPWDHPKCLNIFSQANAGTTRRTKLSSIERGGSGTSKHLLGILTAGNGTARSVSDPAAPRARDARTNAVFPSGTSSRLKEYDNSMDYFVT